VRLILAETARKNDTGDTDWTTNGAGYHINHKYGFGVVDAGAAAEAALDWVNAGEFKSYSGVSSAPSVPIPDGNTSGISPVITVSSSGIASIEYAAISLSITHGSFGDMEITLTGPSGTASVLSEEHFCYNGTTVVPCEFFTTGAAFTFGSIRHLGEPADGVWTLTIKDLEAVNSGTFNNWSIIFYGR